MEKETFFFLLEEVVDFPLFAVLLSPSHIKDPSPPPNTGL